MRAIEIPARRGKAAHVARGQHVKVINTHGEQVVDTWAFNRADLAEFMSMEHTRAHSLHIVPRVGDVLRTNRRRPILTLVEDTSGGIHDTLIAACDRIPLRLPGRRGPSRQLRRQSARRPGRARLDVAARAEPPQSVHEHPLEPPRAA